ncbi:MAG: DNA recombination protein RmuC [Acidobacteriota bacterium]
MENAGALPEKRARIAQAGGVYSAKKELSKMIPLPLFLLVLALSIGSGVWIGFLLAARVSRGQLQQVREAEHRIAQARADALSDQLELASKELAELRPKTGELAAVKQQLMDEQAKYAQMKADLDSTFESAALRALAANAQSFLVLAKQELGAQAQDSNRSLEAREQAIKGLLQPVEETIKRLDKRVEESDAARSRAEALLNDQVKRLAGASESLTNALRKPVVRGSWGEMTLENALENAGLEPEIDFVLQHQTDAEDGKKRTDAIVNLPKGRKLIIDSKNLMESYLALMSAEDEDKRTILAAAHSKSLRAHIKSLSSKEYWRRYEGLDCVILFIPHDGMYHAAIQDEAELIREACEKRVFISNSMSLIPLLKAVRYVLDQERLNKNAEDIKKVGTELYVEVTRFASNMSTIGDRLRSTVAAYNDAIPGLDRFIVSKSRKLKQLGSAKGADAEIPEEIDLEPKLFSSKELRSVNGDASFAIAASDDDAVPAE